VGELPSNYTESLPAATPRPEVVSQETYEIITEIYGLPVLSPEDVINIRYPQIRGLGDDLREKAINEMIERHIFDVNSDRLHVNSFDPSGSGGSYDIDVVYHIMLQSAEILSIIYEDQSTLYHANGSFSAHNAYGITIDLENVTRMQLSDFTRTDLPEEASGIDIYYRIRQSREILGIMLEPKLDIPYYDPRFYPGELGNRTVTIPFEVAPHEFFITPDSIYYINGPFASWGGYNFIKILDEAEPYEFPVG